MKGLAGAREASTRRLVTSTSRPRRTARAGQTRIVLAKAADFETVPNPKLGPGFNLSCEDDVVASHAEILGKGAAVSSPVVEPWGPTSPSPDRAATKSWSPRPRPRPSSSRRRSVYCRVQQPVCRLMGSGAHQRVPARGGRGTWRTPQQGPAPLRTRPGVARRPEPTPRTARPSAEQPLHRRRECLSRYSPTFSSAPLWGSPPSCGTGLLSRLSSSWFGGSCLAWLRSIARG